tara:strand:+ start:72 stop:353 length:282 start_codon:yes stop_codon:yes gene_type:complete
MPNLKKPFKNKKAFKDDARVCYVCKEDNRSLLDVHRIKAGADGGQYTYGNSVCICCRCHRLEQSGRLKILGWYNSSTGRVLHIIGTDGKEDFI